MTIEAMKRALEAMESVASHVAQTAPSDEWAQYCGAMSALRELIWQEPRREWQGLTKEERKCLLQRALRFYDLEAKFMVLAKTIEAKLKEKNT